MAEEHQTLVQDDLPQEGVDEVGARGPRFMTCNRGNLVTALSVFVGILIVGQAVTVYFLTQQQSRISELDATTTRMKLEDMIRRLPGSPPAGNRPRMRIPSFNMPLVADYKEHENLEEIAENSNKLEDAVKYILLRGNPLRKYPSLNGTFLENLRNLRKTMEEEKWAVFDAWLQQWYLFYLVQNTSEGIKPSNTGDNGLLTSQERDLLTVPPKNRNLVFATTSYSTDSLSSYNGETPSGDPLMTLCQMKASERVQIGAYLPQCDDNGDFMRTQCWRGTGYCWCVYKNGTEVPETRTRAKLDCSEITESPGDLEDYEGFAVLDAKM